jgi:hypothetical protein
MPIISLPCNIEKDALRIQKDVLTVLYQQAALGYKSEGEPQDVSVSFKTRMCTVPCYFTHYTASPHDKRTAVLCFCFLNFSNKLSLPLA